MKKKFSINTLIPILSFLILFCVFLIATRGTLVTPQNISNIVSQAFPVIIGGTGVLFVTAMGSTDLSAGANAALSATLGAMAASHLGTWAIFPVAIGTGMLVGALNGLWNSRCKMPSFMMTLAMLIGLRGLLNYFLASNLIYAPTVLITFNTFPVKLAIVAVLVVIFYYVFEYTKIGYYCRAIGENERTVIATGINVKRIRMTAFIISGFMAALFGIKKIVNVGGSTLRPPSAGSGSATWAAASTKRALPSTSRMPLAGPSVWQNAPPRRPRQRNMRTMTTTCRKTKWAKARNTTAAKSLPRPPSISSLPAGWLASSTGAIR